MELNLNNITKEEFEQIFFSLKNDEISQILLFINEKEKGKKPFEDLWKGFRKGASLPKTKLQQLCNKMYDSKDDALAKIFIKYIISKYNDGAPLKEINEENLKKVSEVKIYLLLTKLYGINDNNNLDLENRIDKLIEEYEEKIEKITNEKDKKINELNVEKEEIIAEYEDKLDIKNDELVELNKDLTDTLEKYDDLLKENKKLKEEINENKYVPLIDGNGNIVDALKDLKQYLAEKGLYYILNDLYSFHVSISTRKITIIEGKPGIGKSKLAISYANFFGLNEENDTLLVVPISPSYTEPSDILGFLNPATNKFMPTETNLANFLIHAANNPNKMHMLVFDEMNLAQIEYYFAPFLANLERNEKYITLYAKDATCLNEYPYKIPLYDNLLIVGTINKDETTKELSERLLDRIYLLNLNESDFTSYRNEQLIYRNVVRHYNYKLEDYMKSLPLENPMYELDTNELKLLDSLNALFNNESMPFRISYRNLSNICLFLLLGNNFDREFIFDKALEEVVFSKICGPSLYLKDIISKVKEVLNNYLNLSNFSNSLALLRIKQSELDKYGYTR